MNRPASLQTGLRMRGIGMIEVLVTLLIISVGFLSMAGLQTVAKRSNFDAVQRTTAVILTQDILEKMRANPLSLHEYLTSAVGLGGGTLTEPTQACSSAEHCNTAQLAAYDQWLWEQSIDGATETRLLDGATTETGGLSEPTGCVSGPAAGGAGIYTVTIVWRGLSELTNISDNDCGAGSGKYGDADQFRRIVEVQVYIAS